MASLYKYGVAVHLFKPIIKRGVMDFAVGADWTPVAGDVKISKDGGAAANVTNLPTAITMGNTAMWDFSLTATEMQAKKIRITVADAATKAVEDTLFEVDTYGNPSAEHPSFDSTYKTGGTAQAGASGTITLAAGITAAEYPKPGDMIRIVGGTGQGQTGMVSSFDTSTKVATMVENWPTANPSAASVYEVHYGSGSVLVSSSQFVGEILDTATSGHTTAGTVGKALVDAAGSAANVTAIKTKTDQLTFTSANQVDAHMRGAAGVQLQQNGSGGQRIGGP